MTDRPSAAPPAQGALRLVAARSPVPPGELTAYLRAVSTHCPFLVPSRNSGRMAWTVYQAIDCGAEADVLAGQVFTALRQAVEHVRRARAEGGGAPWCENVVLQGAVPRRAVEWPHWAAKCLYSAAGVMIGKFARGEERTDRHGRRIPPPPASFLPVRAAVPGRDPYFLAGRTPELARALRAGDDGRDVLAAHGLSPSWEDFYPWARQQLRRHRPHSKQPSPSPETRLQ